MQNSAIRFFLVYICILYSPLFSQNVKLKRPLNAADHKIIGEGLAGSCFGLGFRIAYTYSDLDLFGEYSKPEKAANEENAKLLEKTLKGGNGDVSIYEELAELYTRLEKQLEPLYYYSDEKTKLYSYCSKKSKEYINKSRLYYYKKMESFPDSVALLMYKNALREYKMGNYEDAYNACVLSLQADSNYIEAVRLGAKLFIITNQFDNGYIAVRTMIKKEPDNLKNYELLPLLEDSKLFNTIKKHFNDSNYLRGLSVDSLMKMPLFSDHYSEIKGMEKEYFYHVVQQMFLVNVIQLKYTKRYAEFGNLKFNVMGRELELLLDNKRFFEDCIKNKHTKHYYYGYKSLSTIYTFLNNPQLALEYSKKAIELKPKEHCSIANNNAEDYDNLIDNYILLKDNSSIERVLLEKIKFQPKVDPDINDYIQLAQFYLSTSKLKKANEYTELALLLNKKNDDVLLLNAFLSYFNNDIEEALGTTELLCRKDKANWKAWILYACASLQKNDATNAYNALLIAEKLHPAASGIKDNLINEYFEKMD